MRSSVVRDNCTLTPIMIIYHEENAYVFDLPPKSSNAGLIYEGR